MEQKKFDEWLLQNRDAFGPVVPVKKGEKLLRLDFTAATQALNDEILANTNLFIQYINSKLNAAGAHYGIGGYNEHRTVYSRSALFGPSPATTPPAQEGAKAPSRWEGERDADSLTEEETVGYRYADPMLYGRLKEYALQMRSAPTQAEEVLGEALQTKGLGNYHFRRQHIIDRYIADFVCLKKKLVVEVDSLVHQLPENKDSDAQRTKRLNDLGFRLIRFGNEEVLHNLPTVLQQIRSALETDRENNGHTHLHSPTGEQRAEPRRLHLGVDIWGKPYTKVMAPLDAIVHSFAFNNAFGDYGATIILTHQVAGESFHTLYGHLSLNSLKNLYEGALIKKGDVFAEFGIPFENGQWPPHLHFQIIRNLQGWKGDYPGVCAFSEREEYLANCPDPDLILNLQQHAFFC